jgi:bacterioferritin
LEEGHIVARELVLASRDLKAPGVQKPSSLLASADEVIEQTCVPRWKCLWHETIVPTWPFWSNTKLHPPTQQTGSSGIREKEQSMKGDKNVIEYLNKALRHELTAVNQYWLHYRLLDNWGYKMLAKTWRKESIEEMQHADKLIERIIFLDGSPNMQTLESLHIGKTVEVVLDSDLQAELSAHSLYAEAATHCHSVKDYVTRDLFEQLIHDEEEHIDFLETQIELVARIGAELYAQRHIGELDED